MRPRRSSERRVPCSVSTPFFSAAVVSPFFLDARTTQGRWRGSREAHTHRVYIGLCVLPRTRYYGPDIRVKEEDILYLRVRILLRIDEPGLSAKDCTPVHGSVTCSFLNPFGSCREMEDSISLSSCDSSAGVSFLRVDLLTAAGALHVEAGPPCEV